MSTQLLQGEGAPACGRVAARILMRTSNPGLMAALPRIVPDTLEDLFGNSLQEGLGALGGAAGGADALHASRRMSAVCTTSESPQLADLTAMLGAKVRHAGQGEPASTGSADPDGAHPKVKDNGGKERNVQAAVELAALAHWRQARTRWAQMLVS